MLVVFYTINLYILCTYDLFHILLSLWHTYGSIECMYVCIYVWVWSFMHRASSYNMYIKQQDAQISVIRLYFLLDALHVSDYSSPSSGATL